MTRSFSMHYRQCLSGNQLRQIGNNVFLGDRNGVRTPVQWSSDKNAGFSRANPQGLFLPIILDPEYHYEAVNVESQQRNTDSLLWWTKRLLAMRKRWTAFGVGSIEFLRPENRKILAFIRRHDDECVLVVCNLARTVEMVDYAANAALFRQIEHGLVTAETESWIEPWFHFWTHWAGAIFFRTYLNVAREGDFLPKAPPELKILLECHLLNKALYELGYELNNRPDWVRIPLRGILQLMEEVG